jgi:hypothetical protein
MNPIVLRLIVVCAMTGIGRMASAQLPIQFDENTYPTNPENTFGAFTHGDFSAAGALTDGPTSFILDIQDTDGNNGVFGGVGVDFGPFVNGALVPHDFDPAIAEWVLRLKVLPNNRASAIRTSYIDIDDAMPTSGDEHVFEFDLTAISADGAFHDLIQPASAPLFTQGAFGLVAGNGINDPGLRQIQITSVFGSAERLNVEIDYAQIRIVPEPGSLGLMAVLCCGSMFARRQARNVRGGGDKGGNRR